MEYELDIIKLILEDIKPQTEEQSRIKLYLETHHICKQIYVK